jgi:nucleotide-binding universal stress UspA family protein
MEKALEAEAENNLKSLITRVKRAHIPFKTFVKKGNPHAVIAALARSQKIDLIVMGTHGHTGLAHTILGSTTEKVVRQSPCPVLTVKNI